MNPYADITDDTEPQSDSEPCEHVPDIHPQVELFTEKIVTVCVKCGARMEDEQPVMLWCRCSDHYDSHEPNGGACRIAFCMCKAFEAMKGWRPW